MTPPAVTPPAVTTREAPAAAERSATGAPRRERPRSVPAEIREAREIVAIVEQRAREARKEARERASERREHRRGAHGR